MVSDLKPVQDCITNPLPQEVKGVSRFVGIIGDRPSLYAKSPSIWNPTLKKFGCDACYVPFDVEDARLPALVDALRAHLQLLGFNVTVPYKVRILSLLDDVEPKARRIGAVNTVVREGDGRLVGYNTDGQGGIDSLTQVQPGWSEPFVSDLRGGRVLLIGAGGAGAALGHYLAEAVGGAETLVLANRTYATAEALAASIREGGGRAEAVSEADIGGAAFDADLIVNATVKGQSGVRQLPDGSSTCMEPYSALAPAVPAALERPAGGQEEAFYAAWWQRAGRGVSENNRISCDVAARIPTRVGFYDAVYSPGETVFLRHGRLSGHRTMNGKGMNVCQAADGFFNRVMADYLRERDLHTPETYTAIRDFMYQVW